MDQLRFSIHVDPWWRPFLLPWGVTPSRSYVALKRDAVRVRFGFFEHRFPRERIVGARRIPGNFWYGIGWHTEFFRTLTVNGSLGGQIELELAAPERFRLLGLPARCTRLRVSLEEPDAFLRTLGEGSPP